MYRPRSAPRGILAPDRERDVGRLLWPSGRCSDISGASFFSSGFALPVCRFTGSKLLLHRYRGQTATVPASWDVLWLYPRRALPAAGDGAGTRVFGSVGTVVLQVTQPLGRLRVPARGPRLKSCGDR